jgi:7-cyano-7-deazaguanine synthase in queuosine biosynthesis
VLLPWMFFEMNLRFATILLTNQDAPMAAVHQPSTTVEDQPALPPEEPKKTIPKQSVVLLMSGGIDSATLLFELAKDDFIVHPLFINYRQKALEREVEACHQLIDMARKFWPENVKELQVASVTNLYLVGQPLLVNGPAIDGRKDGELKGRNALFATMAAVYAGQIGAKEIVFGFLQGYPDSYKLNKQEKSIERQWDAENTGYSDCGLSFLVKAERAVQKLFDKELHIRAPYLKLYKHHVVLKAVDLSVPIRQTWSCYSEGPQRCGTCKGCVALERGLNIASWKSSLVPNIFYKEAATMEAQQQPQQEPQPTAEPSSNPQPTPTPAPTPAPDQQPAQPTQTPAPQQPQPQPTEAPQPAPAEAPQPAQPAQEPQQQPTAEPAPSTPAPEPVKALAV